MENTMVSFKSQVQGKTWKRDAYLLTTDPSTVPIPELIEIYGSEEWYWTKHISAEAAKEMLENSLSFALFDTSADGLQGRFIGLARCVTDFVSFSYLTDVWVNGDYRGEGLGSWMIKCIGEALDTMPYLRRSMLFTGDWERSVPFYEKVMGMKVMNEAYRGNGLAYMEKKGEGHPSYGSTENGYN